MRGVALGGNPVGQDRTDRYQATVKKGILRIGTWNVRTLLRAAQLANVKTDG